MTDKKIDHRFSIEMVHCFQILNKYSLLSNADEYNDKFQTPRSTFYSSPVLTFLNFIF